VIADEDCLGNASSGYSRCSNENQLGEVSLTVADRPNAGIQ